MSVSLSEFCSQASQPQVTTFHRPNDMCVLHPTTDRMFAYGAVTRQSHRNRRAYSTYPIVGPLFPGEALGESSSVLHAHNTPHSIAPHRSSRLDIPDHGDSCE